MKFYNKNETTAPRGRNNVTICWGAEAGHQCQLMFCNTVLKFQFLRSRVYSYPPHGQCSWPIQNVETCGLVWACTVLHDLFHIQ